MRLKLLLLAFITYSAIAVSLAQVPDTTRIQTFTFSDIYKRKGTFVFPPATETWEKIYMYYTLKCDPLTPWDNFPCGEWDYLTYTVVYDSTGILEQVPKTHTNFELIGNLNISPDSFSYTTVPTWDKFKNTYKWTVIDTIQSQTIDTLGTSNPQLPCTITLPTNQPMGRTQHIWTATELATVLTPNTALNGLQFEVTNNPIPLDLLTIRIKHTTATNLSNFDNLSLTTVFQSPYTPVLGTNTLYFSTPFIWNGVAGLMIEFSYETSPNGNIELAGDTTNSFSGIYAAETNGYYECNHDGFFIQDAPNVFAAIDSQITVAFWAYGDAVLPLNTTVFDANNENGERILNVHLPWDNNSVYWDAGKVPFSGNDRIFKAATAANIEGQWNHWAFTKNVKTGTMKIYLNGLSWASGSGKTLPMRDIVSFAFGKTAGKEGFDGTYYGGIDEFQIWNKELSSTTISQWFRKSLDNTHPDYSNLICYYPFDTDNGFTALDASPNAHNATTVGMPKWKTVAPLQTWRNPTPSHSRPMIQLLSGTYNSHIDSVVKETTITRPLTTVIKYDNLAQPYLPTDTIHVYKSGYNYTYTDGIKSDSLPAATQITLYKQLNPYTQTVEKIDQYEIGRFITPYGIGLDLGPQGFRWIYDVTDYAPLLHDYVTLSAGNTQELLDLEFVMIKGTPSRPVQEIQYLHNRDMGSYLYKNIADNSSLPADTLTVLPTTTQAKLHTLITGHGHEGIENSSLGLIHCCEWADKTHNLTFNNAASPQLSWDLKVDGACALNPVIAQGGNWAPDRDGGWCPSMPVAAHDFEIGSYLNNQQVVVDYGIEPVPANNTGQGTGNYVVTMHLIGYGNHNFQQDAAMDAILRPSKDDLYRRFNPICTRPLIRIRNNGQQDIFTLTIEYGVVGGTTKTYNWAGFLSFDKTLELELPMTANDWVGNNINNPTFYAQVKSPNGQQDEYAANNRIESPFALPPVYPQKMVVRLRNNAIPSDVVCRIYNESGTIVYNKTNMPVSTLFIDTVNFTSNGCHYLVLTTNEGLGLNYPLIPQVGSGSLALQAANGTNLVTFETDFGKSIIHHFTVNFGLSIDEQSMDNALQVFPNPAQQQIQIELQNALSQPATLTLTDLTGKVLSTQTWHPSQITSTWDLSPYAYGLYFLTLQNATTKITQKIIKE